MSLNFLSFRNETVSSDWIDVKCIWICVFSLQGVFSQVFDLQASDFDNDDSYQRKGYVLSEVRIILAFCF